MDVPLVALMSALKQSGLGRMLEHFARQFPDAHLKDVDFESIGPGREVVIDGRRVVNFGCDSFLGLDRDPRLLEVLKRGIERWGAHSGASRAFASVAANREAEAKIARWLGTEDCVIYPSVSLANIGAIPGLVDKRDVIAVDEFAHNSIHDGVRLARGNGVRTLVFAHDDVNDLEKKLTAAQPYRFALVCVDGVYSMSGTVPPLSELAAACRRRNGILYVDDAHGTGVVGPRGIGVVRDTLGNYENTLVVGSLSKAFSCLGGFIGCPAGLKQQLQARSNTYVFGGPIAPCYCDGINWVVDLLSSPEYDQLRQRLRTNLHLFVQGAKTTGFEVVGGLTPIVTLPIGDEELTLLAGKYLFDRGFYVQSVTFPAVPFRAGVLRVQINANHESEQITGLLGALAELQDLSSSMAA
jgi:7-keto-8-aminopelargonate synthetase-like enzyme